MKKIGRPRKYPAEEKMPVLTFRCRGRRYEQLKREAELRGLSLSETINQILMTVFKASP